MKKEFKSMPNSLKVVFVLTVLWIFGSISGIGIRYEQGLPLFGTWIKGISAALTVLILDIIGPLAFLYATYKRLSWGVKVAYTYMGIFILNSLIAIFTHSETLGTNAIVIPIVITAILLYIVHKNKNYYN